jgi:fructose-bisphosphate aldolase class II
MPLVSIRDEVRKAQAGGYAVPLFLVFDLASAEGIFQALREKRSPAMVGVYADWVNRASGAALAAMIRALAAEAAAPVSLALDHGATLDDCRRAISLGFTDIMYDGSKLPLAENIAIARRAAEEAHAAGAGLEAELGHIGTGKDYAAFGAIGKGFTDPADAERFCAETGVDLLAVAIGSAHGVYQGEPRLDLDRLREIRRRVSVPLSLHGGTGLSDEQFRAAIAGGIAKINIFTDLALAAADRVAGFCRESDPSYFDILGGIREAFRERSGRYVDAFGSAGKA